MFIYRLNKIGILLYQIILKDIFLKPTIIKEAKDSYFLFTYILHSSFIYTFTLFTFSNIPKIHNSNMRSFFTSPSTKISFILFILITFYFSPVETKTSYHFCQLNKKKKNKKKKKAYIATFIYPLWRVSHQKYILSPSPPLFLSLSLFFSFHRYISNVPRLFLFVPPRIHPPLRFIVGH